MTEFRPSDEDALCLLEAIAADVGTGQCELAQYEAFQSLVALHVSRCLTEKLLELAQWPGIPASEEIGGGIARKDISASAVD